MEPARDTPETLRILWDLDHLAEGEYIERLRQLITIENVDRIAAALPPRVQEAFRDFADDWTRPDPVIQIGDGTPVVDSPDLLPALVLWRARWQSRGFK